MKVSFVVGFTSYGPLKWFLKQGNFRSEVVSIRNSVCLIFLWKACILSGVGVNSCERSVYFVVLVSRRFFVGVYLYVRSCACPAWTEHTFCFDKISFLAFSVFVCFVDVLQVAKIGCVKVFFYIVWSGKKCTVEQQSVVSEVGYPLYDRVVGQFFLPFIVVSSSKVAFFQNKSFLFSIENHQLNVKT